jgi:UDP-2-acetamido-3-amino-2,3-dideoxy-glucuronate N-acetyltransferase
MPAGDYRHHPSAVIDDGAVVGAGTAIWHFVHVSAGARIGEDCTVGQGCYLGAVRIGNRCKLQNHVSVYDGVTLEDDVFVGPSCVFTNIKTPRAAVSRRGEFVPTLVGRGASLGANCTIVCGVTIGEYAAIGAGAVVTRDVAAHALVVGNPARPIGWVCECGQRLPPVVTTQRTTCTRCQLGYELRDGRLVRS